MSLVGLQCVIVVFSDNTHIFFIINLLIKGEVVALFYLFCGYLCSVSLPNGVIGCYVVCSCDISGSYSLTSLWDVAEIY